MLVEKKREAELRRRRGSTVKTILQTIWLLIAIAGAYYLITYLETEGFINYNQFYRAGIPRSVPTWVFMGVLMLVVVIIMQFVFSFGYFIANPKAYRKAGQARAESDTNDPSDFESY